MQTARILSVLEKAKHLNIPEQLMKDALANDELAYVNECGYEFLKLYELIPNVIASVDFLPCCIIHDWRRRQVINGTYLDKVKYDIEFLNNLLLTVNECEMSPDERVALTEICYLYFQSVMADQIVDGKPWYMKFWNIVKVLALVMWFPVEATIRAIKLRYL